MRSKRMLKNPNGTAHPFLDWDRDGDELVRRPSEPASATPSQPQHSATEPTASDPPKDAWNESAPPTTPSGIDREASSAVDSSTRDAPQEKSAGGDRKAVMRVNIPQMIGRWLLLGILGGAVMGGLVGLFAGPIGFAIGFAVGGILGAMMAAAVLIIGTISYGVRYLAGRPAETSSQHVTTWILPPAILLGLPLLFGAAGLIITGPALFVGLIWGPSAVRKSLRPVFVRRGPFTQGVVPPGPPRGPGRAAPTNTTNPTNDSPQEVI